MSAVFWLSFGAVWLLLVIQGLVMLELVRQIADLRQGGIGRSERPSGPIPIHDLLGVGRDIPPARSLTRAATHEPTTWADVLDSGSTALIFLSPSCTTCWNVAARLPWAAAQLPIGQRIVPLISSPRLDHAWEFVRRNRLGELAVVEEGEDVEESLNLLRKPSAVVLRGSKVVHAATVLEGEHVLQLLNELPDAVNTRDGEPVINDLAAV
jgi:hypothetical protein